MSLKYDLPRQKLFVKHYCVTRNLTEAAVLAGYDPKWASRIGWALMRKPHIRAEVDAHLEKISEKVDLDLEHLVEDLVEIKAKCMQAEPVVDANGQPTGEWKFDSRGAIKAIELIGRYLKLLDKENTLNLGQSTLEALIGGSMAKPTETKEPTEKPKRGYSEDRNRRLAGRKSKNRSKPQL